MKDWKCSCGTVRESENQISILFCPMCTLMMIIQDIKGERIYKE